MPESELLQRLSEFSELGVFLLGVVYLLVRYFPWAKVGAAVFGREPSSKPPPSGESVAEAVLRRFREDEKRREVQTEIRDHSKRTADAMETTAEAIREMNGKVAKSIDMQTENMRINAERHEQTTTMLTSLAELLHQAKEYKS